MPKTRRRRADREQFWRDTIAAWKESGQSVPRSAPPAGSPRPPSSPGGANSPDREQSPNAPAPPAPSPSFAAVRVIPDPTVEIVAPRRAGRPRPGRGRPGRRRPARRRARGWAVLTLGLTGRIWICTDAARRPQELRRAPGGGDLPPGQGPALGRPVRVPQQARGPAEDPGLAGGRVRPLPPPAGEGDVRLPDRRHRRGEHHRDRTGDDPRRDRTRVGEAAAAVRTPGRRVIDSGFRPDRRNPRAGSRVPRVWRPHPTPTPNSPPSGPRSRTCGG